MRLTGDVGGRLGGRALLGASALAGLGGSPSIAVTAAVVVLVAAYVALAVGRTVPGAAGPRAPARLPLPAVVVADLVVLAAGQLLLAADGLLALAVTAPVLVAAVTAAECDLAIARRVTAAALAIMVAVQVVGPGPEPGRRTLIAVVGGVLLSGWTAVFAAAGREARAQLVAGTASLEALKEQVVTTVSHELRTPLTIIQGLTSTLVSRWDALPETRRLDLIDALGLNVASLDASVLHFLDAGRLSKGGWQVRPQPVQAGPLLDKVLAKLEPVLAGHEVQRRIECDTVWADPEALERMLELLLVNACRFSGPAAPISVRAAGSPETGWEISVADRGQGISPGDLPKVFDRLWRADVAETGISRGAGLGLAIVKELVERHGGTVTATSTKNRGSTFRLNLPPPSTEGSVLFDDRPRDGGP